MKKIGCTALQIAFALGLLLVAAKASAQQPVLRKYTVNDGLPSSEAYRVYQDSQGFMWFTTDRGVARFDGYQFMVIDSRYGIPSNTVFGIYEDYQNRIWFWDISGNLWWWKDGKITIIPSEQVGSRDGAGIRSLSVSRGDTICVSYESGKHSRAWLYPDGTRKLLPALVGITDGPRRVNFFAAIDGNSWGSEIQVRPNWPSKLVEPNGFEYSIYIEGDSVQLPVLKGDAPAYSQVHYNSGDTLLISVVQHLVLLVNKKVVKYIELPASILDVMVDAQQNIWVSCWKQGVFQYSAFALGTLEGHYLNNHSLTQLLQDREGGYWMTSHSDGVYYSQSLDILQYVESGTSLSNTYTAVWALPNGKLLAASKSGQIVRLEDGELEPIALTPVIADSRRYPRSIVPMLDGNLAVPVANGYRVIDATGEVGVVTIPDLHIAGVNKLFFASDSTRWLSGTRIFAAVRNNKVVFDSRSQPGIPASRVLALQERSDGAMWIGMNGGLFLFSEDSVHQIMNPLLQNQRINDIAEMDSGYTAVATMGHGVFVLHGDEAWQIAESTGFPLLSDLCNCLFWDGLALWVGTNKGLSKVQIERFDQRQCTIANLTAADGLSSNEINDIYVSKTHVVLATNNGLTNFPVERVKASWPAPIVHITDVQAAEADSSVTDHYSFTAGDNYFTVRFLGLSYHNAGKLRYKYRMMGLDADWRGPTNATEVTYPALDAGTYTFQVMAGFPGGIWSEPTVPITVEVEPALADKWWVRSLALSGIVGLSYLLFLFRLRQIRGREQARVELNKRIAQLELKALRAQMNPHFTFNTMNAIQHFIINNNAEQAHSYLGMFARLIRMTLENSEEQFVPLENEVELLKLYLDLEALRFNPTFKYSFELEPEIDLSFEKIPPMLIQPYLENAIWHGIANKKDGVGRLVVSMKKTDRGIECCIEDNGVGRSLAQELKSKNQPGKRSMGMSITKERLQILHGKQNSNFDVRVEDLLDEQGLPAGTRVRVHIPTA